MEAVREPRAEEVVVVVLLLQRRPAEVLLLRLVRHLKVHRWARQAVALHQRLSR